LVIVLEGSLHRLEARDTLGYGGVRVGRRSPELREVLDHSGVSGRARVDEREHGRGV
jgi:hypothetical protein